MSQPLSTSAGVVWPASLDRRATRTSRGPRILLYSHDTYCLGHLRRTLALARQLSRDLPDASFLMLSGSPLAHSYELPERLDYVSLPAISKRSSGEYEARTDMPFREILALRESVIFNAAYHFAPDLVLVDKAAAGMKGEMVRTLDYQRAHRPATKLVLGMSDIEDDPATVRDDWHADGVLRLLEDVYDRILLYGLRSVYDPVREYGLSARVARKIVVCGYICRPERFRSKGRIRRELPTNTDRLVVVAAGSGDGFHLLTNYLDMLQSRPADAMPFDSFVVTGPLMAGSKLASLHALAKGDPTLRFVQFTPYFFDYLNAADAVVSMGGYDSMCELLSLNQRAIVVPRVRPCKEQLIRAEIFAARGLVQMIHPDELTPARLYGELCTALTTARPPSAQTLGIDLDGAPNASHAIQRLLAARRADVRARGSETAAHTRAVVPA